MPTVKYDRLNTHSSEFMRPPTEPLEGRLIALCRDYEGKINRKALELTQRGTPTLRVGTELEILLFAEDFDPKLHKTSDQYSTARRPINPNYSLEHEDNVTALVEKAEMPATKGGLADVLWKEDPINVATLFSELRTAPGNVEQYILAMQQIQRFFQTEGEAHHIRPVNHSQHIHISLTGPRGGNNLLLKSEAIDFAIQKGIVDMYHRAAALLLLPEELEEPDSDNVGSDYGVGLQLKGSETDRKDPGRLEARIAGSEYMFDPYLNLLLHLVGIYRGLEYAANPEQIDEDFPLKKAPSDYTQDDYESIGYFAITEEYPSHRNAAHRLGLDPVLRRYLGVDLAEQLSNIAYDYIEVSEGEIPVMMLRQQSKNRYNFDEIVPTNVVRRDRRGMSY